MTAVKVFVASDGLGAEKEGDCRAWRRMRYEVLLPMQINKLSKKNLAVVFFETRRPFDDERRYHFLNSSKASLIVYPFMLGSLAMRSPSSMAASVSALGVSGIITSNGRRCSRRTALVNTLNSDETVKPVASQKAVIPALSAGDIDIVRLAIDDSPFVKTGGLYHNSGARYNIARDKVWRRGWRRAATWSGN